MEVSIIVIPRDDGTRIRNGACGFSDGSDEKCRDHSKNTGGWPRFSGSTSRSEHEAIDYRALVNPMRRDEPIEALGAAQRAFLIRRGLFAYRKNIRIVKLTETLQAGSVAQWTINESFARSTIPYALLINPNDDDITSYWTICERNQILVTRASMQNREMKRFSVSSQAELGMNQQPTELNNRGETWREQRKSMKWDGGMFVEECARRISSCEHLNALRRMAFK